MNERISSIDNLRFCNSNGNNDMGRFGRRLDEKVEKEIKDRKDKFETYFQEALKDIKEVKENV